MTADTGTLTTVLEQFLVIFRLGQQNIGIQAWSLLTVLATIELILISLWWALTGQEALAPLIRKFLIIGFFVFVVQNYSTYLKTIVEGFIQTGKTASSASGDALASIRDPSTIVDAGFFVALPVLDHLKSFSGVDALLHLHDILITGICALGILTAYFIIAIQVFVTYLEFSIISTLGLILIPFGVFKHTAFLAEKAFGAIISFGVRLMVLGFLVSVTMPVLKTFTLPPDPTWGQLFNLLVICFAVAALSWHAPGVAAGLLSGGPSLTAGTAADTIRAGAFAGVGATLATSAGIQTTTRAAGSAAGLASQNIGVAKAGWDVSSNSSRKKGAGPINRALAQTSGALGGVIRNSVNTAITQPVQNLKQSISSAFQSKQDTVPGFESLRARTSSGGSINTQGRDSQYQGDLSQNSSTYSQATIKSALRLAKQATPSPAQVQRGNEVPLKIHENGKE